MTNLGAIANALKSGGTKVLTKVGLKAIPGVGTATALLWPKALASDEQGYWGDDNKWHTGTPPSKSNNSPSYNVSSGDWQGPIQKPSDPGSKSSGSGGSSSNSNQKIIDAIGKGWDDTGDDISSTGKSLGSAKNYISNLGKVRDKYIDSLTNWRDKTNEAISGNKKLIEENQKRDLDSLAGDTRKSMDNTNVMMGVMGATGGSASKMASRAIARSAGKERAKTLTGYGDETSKQNQYARQAAEEYKIKKAQAEEWEKNESKRAMEEYKEKEKALERLKDKRSGWKKEDIEAESDKNLNKLMSSLANISSWASNFTTNLALKYQEYGGLADELDVAAVGTEAPAELETPDFNENIDLESGGENEEDWYDPNKTGKREIKGYDALGNPIYEDAEVVE